MKELLQAALNALNQIPNTTLKGIEYDDTYELAAWISRKLKEENNVIHITWCVDDVIDRAKEQGITIGIKKAREVLAEVKRTHDCNYGVTWETLDYHTEEILSNQLKN